jgi:hypothetical protein
MGADQRNSVVAFRDRSGDPYWQVTFKGKLQRPCFNSKGAAAAFLDLLVRDKKKPEPIE